MIEEALIEMHKKMKERHVFEPGQIVNWKPGLKNRRSDGPFIVHDIFDTPIINPVKETGSPYYREPIDIVLGSIDADGDFVLYHYDSRRLQPVK